MMKMDYYLSMLEEFKFKPCIAPDNYPVGGTCYKIHPSMGTGYYWVYHSNRGYLIKLHNFTLKEDMVINSSIPECLSVTYYESISGEELTPYHRLNNHVIKSFLGGEKPYKALMHKNIPIHSIGIEYAPSFYEPYLNTQYDGIYQNPQDVFRCIDETASFPEIVQLLNQLHNYHGFGISIPLFYDAKAAETLSLVFEHHRTLNTRKSLSISVADQELLQATAAYMKDHYADSLTIDLLSKISCMGSTKLKKCFKAYFGSTILEYMQSIRISQAEQLLAYTDLTIGQVSSAVGYTNAGRFAELFRKSSGILPLEYRKMSRGSF